MELHYKCTAWREIQLGDISAEELKEIKGLIKENPDRDPFDLLQENGYVEADTQDEVDQESFHFLTEEQNKVLMPHLLKYGCPTIEIYDDTTLVFDNSQK